MKRITIIGGGGAGKSTFSRQLGERINLPVYHLDSLFWNPGWVETPKEQWDDRIKELLNEEKWIIDGNYRRTLEARIQKSDTVIFLDMPTYLRMYRIVKRRIMYHGKTRPDMREGCKEQLDWEFVKWVWNYNKNSRKSVMEILDKYNKSVEVIVLKNGKEVKCYLESFKLEY